MDHMPALRHVFGLSVDDVLEMGRGELSAHVDYLNRLNGG